VIILFLYLIQEVKFFKKNLSLKHPFGIDIDIVNKIIYVADKTHITSLTLGFQFLSSFKFPTDEGLVYGYRGLKVDNDRIYLTINGLHQIFVCAKDGILLKKFGTTIHGSSVGSFHYPEGLTLNQQYLYVCDNDNHRIQILTKQDGTFHQKWGSDGWPKNEQGSFCYPLSIYLNKLEELFYIGDYHCIQLFTKDGICLQRINEDAYGDATNLSNAIYGICIMDDRLYVSDVDNKRIQIFKR